MINEISLTNTSLSQTIILNRSNSSYLLDDDGIDWGEVLADISTYTSTTRIGVGVNNVSISRGRVIKFEGWMINDLSGTIEEKKDILNTFCNPFDDIVIAAGEYKIQGKFNQAIKYSNRQEENNEIVCSFLMYIFCANPLFTLYNEQEASNYKVYKKAFHFPLYFLPPESVVFGLRHSLDNITITNNGTLATGFRAYIYASDDVTGLSITNTTTGEEFKLKSGITLEAGDILMLDTVIGTRELKIGDSMETLENAFSALDLSSDFIQLKPGENTISISCITGDITTLSAEFFVSPLFYSMEDL